MHVYGRRATWWTIVLCAREVFLCCFFGLRNDSDGVYATGDWFDRVETHSSVAVRVFLERYKASLTLLEKIKEHMSKVVEAHR